MTETTKDLIARLMQHVEDTMCEAEVDYPAGHRAGARVSYDSDSLQTYFETELAAALAREAGLREALKNLVDHPAFGRNYISAELASKLDAGAAALGVKP